MVLQAHQSRIDHYVISRGSGKFRPSAYPAIAVPNRPEARPTNSSGNGLSVGRPQLLEYLRFQLFSLSNKFFSIFPSLGSTTPMLIAVLHIFLDGLAFLVFDPLLLSTLGSGFTCASRSLQICHTLCRDFFRPTNQCHAVFSASNLLQRLRQSLATVVPSQRSSDTDFHIVFLAGMFDSGSLQRCSFQWPDAPDEGLTSSVRIRAPSN